MLLSDDLVYLSGGEEVSTLNCIAVKGKGEGKGEG